MCARARNEGFRTIFARFCSFWGVCVASRCFWDLIYQLGTPQAHWGHLKAHSRRAGALFLRFQLPAGPGWGRAAKLIFAFQRPHGRYFGVEYDLGHHSIQETKRNTAVFVFKAPMPLLRAQNGIFTKFTVGARARTSREASARADERGAIRSNFTFRVNPRNWVLGILFLICKFGGLPLGANLWYLSPTHSRAQCPKMKEIGLICWPKCAETARFVLPIGGILISGAQTSALASYHYPTHP